MIRPVISAVSEPINTAAADKSFIFLILSCFSGEIKSAIFSIDELMISRQKTSPMEKTIAIHSLAETLKNNPASTTTIAANK